MKFTSLILITAMVVTFVDAKPPHIVFILADDYGFHDIGYHNHIAKTPNLDILAANGTKLENYYVQPICTPTRSQLMSGRYQIHTGLQHGIIWPPQPHCLPLTDPTLADKLKEAGYSTHAVGKWHLGMYKKACWPTRRGFDSYFGTVTNSFGYLTGSEDYYSHKRGCGMPDFPTCKHWYGLDLYDNEQSTWDYQKEYSTFLFVNKSKTIITSHDKSKPLFLYLPFQAVHSPLQVPQKYKDLYPNITDKARQTYLGMVSCMDEGIGNITQHLTDEGLWNETLIIFSTDNGGQILDGGNNWPLRGWKGSLWEGGTHGAGFVTGGALPQKRRGTINQELIHVSDWFPTIVYGVAGWNLNGTSLDGFNQWPAISDGQPSLRQELVHNIDPLFAPARLSGYKWKAPSVFNSSIRAAIRVGDWKLITGNPGNGSWISPPEDGTPSVHPHEPTSKHLWLFNIKEDPNEYFDLSDKRTDKVKELFDRLSYYYKGAVPVSYPGGDPNCNPALHNNTWTNWE
ncbi:Arylsulfatase B [Holothuria leucospilota]|uniref:Arylsulfatase B n=1 Tax=Holothuria leucospilota TaxID=206669 RepID=A0A9Q0YHE0_HOLLE|nr:Arylsulfatase B [Holothuria leucospilota]